VTEAIGLRLLDRGVAVVSEHDGLMVPWLLEMATPGFEEIDPGRAEITVFVGTRTSLQPDFRPDDEEWPCFAFGEQTMALPGRRDGSSIVLWHKSTGIRFTLHPDRVEVEGESGDLRLRGWCFRAVRELVLAPPHSAGRIELHASGVELDGRVALFAGPKGSGKTTILAHVVASTRAALVTNDRAVAIRNGRGFETRAIPTIVTVRPRTHELLPDLFGEIEPQSHRTNYTIAELAAGTSIRRQTWPGGSTMTPTYLAKLLASRLSAGGLLACIAFVAVDLEVERFAVDRLEPDEAERLLDEACFRHAPEVRLATVFEEMLGNTEVSRGDVALMQELRQSVPCARVRVGERFLAEEKAAQELLMALLETE
jgi:hypothetical protein